ncbi:hypothetical protein RQY33_002129, partial [Providencia rettgeri]|nr:hypothetical protein [Providencia rettgeri]
LALKPLNVPTTQLPNYPTTQLPNYPTTQLPNYPTTQLPNYPTTQLLLTTRLIYLILFLFAEPLVMNITIANGSSRCKVVSNSSLLFELQRGWGVKREELNQRVAL